LSPTRPAKDCVSTEAKNNDAAVSNANVSVTIEDVDKKPFRQNIFIPDPNIRFKVVNIIL
jgi:hypothetical protein